MDVLPIELIEMLLDRLDDDHSALGASSLTCRALSVPAQSRLFHSVKADKPGFDQMLCRAPHLVESICQICFTTSFPPIIASPVLPNVTSLLWDHGVWETEDYDRYHQLCDVLPRVLPGLTSVALQDIELRLPLLELLLCFPELKNVTLTRVGVYLADAPERGIGVRPCTLHCVKILEQSGFHEDIFLEWLARDTFDVRSLRTFSYSQTDYDMPLVYDVIKGCTITLVNLALGFEDNYRACTYCARIVLPRISSTKLTKIILSQTKRYEASTSPSSPVCSPCF